MDLMKNKSTPIHILREPPKPFLFPPYRHCNIQYYHDNEHFVFITSTAGEDGKSCTIKSCTRDELRNQGTPIQILKKPPERYPSPECRFMHCNLQYYYDNGNFVFITADDAIYKYNLDQQTFAKRYEPPAEIMKFNEPVSHFDPRTGIIYVVNGYKSWITLDTNTRRWNTSFIEHRLKRTPRHSFIYIPPPINQLHVIIDDTHYSIYDADDHKDNENYFVKGLVRNAGIGTMPFSNGSEYEYKRSKFVYNLRAKQLMMFVEKTNDILTCNIYDKDQEFYEWEKSKISLKYTLPEFLPWTNFEVILGFDQILFVFNLERWCIECIDLKHPEHGSYIQLIDRELLSERELVFEHVVKDNKNNLHFLKLNDSKDDVYNNGKTCHFTVPLFELIPLDILRNNTKYWESIIDGYCIICEKDDNSPFIPYNIKQLILQSLINSH